MAKITRLKTQSSGAVQGNASYTAVNQSNPRNIYDLYTSEFSSLTPTSVKSYLESARKGLNFWKSLLFDEIRRRDPHIGAVCQTRKLAVASSKYMIECEDENLCEFVKGFLDKFNFTNFITDIIESSIQGVSLFEINYEYVEGFGVVPSSIALIPNHLVLYDEKSQEYRIMDIAKADGYMLRILSANITQDTIDVNRVPQTEVDPMKLFEVHSFDGNSQNGLLNGCIDSLIWIYLFKSYGIKDWSTYTERFATPIRVGKYDPMMSSMEKNSLTEAVRNVGHNSYIVHPNTVEVSLLTDSAKSSSSDLFQDFTRYWNEQVSIRVLGQTLTTQMQSSGSYAAAKVHDNVRADIKHADMILVESSVNELIQRVIELNFPSVKDFPKFSFVENEDIEFKIQKANFYKTLKDTGVSVKPEQIAEEFGLELAEPAPPTPPEPSPTFNEADDEISKLIEEIWKEKNK